MSINIRDLADSSQKSEVSVKYSVIEYNGVELLMTDKALKHAIIISHEFTKDPWEKVEIKQLADNIGIELDRRKKHE